MAGGTRGRRRISNEEKKKRGTYRKDRDGRDPVKVPEGTPDKPDYLNGIASDYWDEIVPLLVDSGVATKLDASAIATLCENWQLYRKYRDALDKGHEGFKNASLFNGISRAASTAQKDWLTLATKFGLTAMDRANMSPSTKVETKNPLDEFFEAQKKAVGLG